MSEGPHQGGPSNTYRTRATRSTISIPHRLHRQAATVYHHPRTRGDVQTGDGIERACQESGSQAHPAPHGGEGGSVLQALGSKAEERSKRRKRKKDSYAKYLESDTWKRIRGAALERDKHTCRACGNQATVVHHIRYPKHLGQERLHWLYSLCRSCHDRIHLLCGPGVTLREATRIVIESDVRGSVTVLPDDQRLGSGETRRRQLGSRDHRIDVKRKKKRRKQSFKVKTVPPRKAMLIDENDQLHAIQQRNRERRERNDG